jgi:hypothetical protein
MKLLCDESINTAPMGQSPGHGDPAYRRRLTMAFCVDGRSTPGAFFGGRSECGTFKVPIPLSIEHKEAMKNLTPREWMCPSVGGNDGDVESAMGIGEPRWGCAALEVLLRNVAQPARLENGNTRKSVAGSNPAPSAIPSRGSVSMAGPCRFSIGSFL